MSGRAFAVDQLCALLTRLEDLTPEELAHVRASEPAAEIRKWMNATPRAPHERLTGGGRPCFVCMREAVRGLAYKGQPVCSKCAPYSGQGEMMLEFTETEEEAIEAGGAAAGAFLDETGKTDLGELTPEQWTRFLGKFLLGYSTHMREEAAKYPPF